MPTSRPSRRRSGRRVVTALVLVTAAAACSDDPVAPPVEEPERNTRRLLVTDQSAATASLVDVDDGTVLLIVPLAEQVGTAYASSDRRYGFLHERNAGRVTVVDGGVWAEAHGDHAHVRRATPRVLPFTLTGARPTHGLAHAGTVTVFFDGDGSAAFLDEAALAGGTPTPLVIGSGVAHHGAALRFAGGYFLTNGTPITGVNRHAASGEVLQRFGDCPGLHGDAANGRAAVFGCSDGVLLVRHSAGAFTGTKVAMPGALDGYGVGYLLGRDDFDFFVARAQQGSLRRLARLDAATGAVTPIELPGGYPLAWDVTHGGARLVVLDDAGSVHVLNAATLAVEGTIADVVAAIPADERGRAPTIAAADDAAYVSSPKTGELLVLDLLQRRVAKRIAVGGAPGRIALLGVAAAVEHHDD